MENKQIIHTFKYNAHDLNGLFEGTNRLSTFCRKLEIQAEADTNRYSRDQYVGDGFEFLVELIFKLLPYNRILGGIHDYNPTQVDDNGVDGIAKNWDGKDCVIQAKYRGDSRYQLTANNDHLANLVKEATIKYRIPPHDSNKKQVSKYFIITTAKDLHYYTRDEFFLGSVECIGRETLRKLLDNNRGFWNECRKIVNNLEK